MKFNSKTIISKKCVFLIFFMIGLFSLNAQPSSSDQNSNKTTSFILKTSPFDFIIGRFILAPEFRLSKKSSIELCATYDYLKQTDFIYGNVSDFGKYFLLNSRYKYFPNWGQSFIKETKRNQMNGFYFAGGLEIGQSPLLHGPNESVFKYVANTHEERSIFFGGIADMGYSWIIKRWNIETFVGFNVRQNTNARSARLVGEALLFEYAPIITSSTRFGIRFGYVIYK